MTRNTYAARIKRVLDILGSATLLLVTAPVHAACATAILVTDGAPIYYRGARAGYLGQEFTLFKFRTMYADTEKRFGAFPPAEAVTPAGNILRRTSLDELPQLLNVLRGDMSLVGPRPALPSQVVRYTNAQRERLDTRPGMTGLAQILYRNSAPWSMRIQKDIEYVRNLTFRGDLRILLQTIPSVIFGKGQLVGQVPNDVDDLAEGSLAVAAR